MFANMSLMETKYWKCVIRCAIEKLTEHWYWQWRFTMTISLHVVIVINLERCVAVRLSSYCLLFVSVCAPVCLSVSMSICQVCVSICLSSVCVSICLSSVCVSICLSSVSVCLSDWDVLTVYKWTLNVSNVTTATTQATASAASLL